MSSRANRQFYDMFPGIWEREQESLRRALAGEPEPPRRTTNIERGEVLSYIVYDRVLGEVRYYSPKEWQQRKLNEIPHYAMSLTK